MNSLELFNNVCNEGSKIITQRYSTSFSMGIRLFAPQFRQPIYSIYAFVRFADEIVDTFHHCDKAHLLQEFKEETFKAIEQKISLNPVLQAYQLVVNQYKIENELTEAFLKSMEMDLWKNTYNDSSSYQDYIYGSAEVVGLMCLRVFCNNDDNLYQKLAPASRALGSAFQKINFLRDIKSDFDERGRVYFPNIDFEKFTEENKKDIEKDIKADFDAAYSGIVQLPRGARLGVYLAYRYYLSLFYKIQNKPACAIACARLRVNDTRKMILLCKSTLRHSFNML
jgi:phytoene/squalene synthetase